MQTYPGMGVGRVLRFLGGHFHLDAFFAGTRETSGGEGFYMAAATGQR
jgi:hypothetical protein